MAFPGAKTALTLGFPTGALTTGTGDKTLE
jgi:hypothetical protein